MRGRFFGVEKKGRWRLAYVPIAVLVGLVVAVVALAIILWSVKRRPDAKFHVVGHTSIRQLLPSIAGLTHSDLQEGNRVQVLQNGAFFPPLFQDIRQARRSIHFETFLWEKGAIGDALAQLLAAKARQGVEVRLLLDASGTRKMGDETVDLLRKSGCRVAKYHNLTVENLGVMNARDHRKITVIDGRIGYVGGHCIVDSWTGNAQDKKHFRDISVRVEGPVVNRLQSAFTENWIEASGEVPSGPAYFPALPAAGTTPAHLVFVSPAGSPSSVELLYLLAIDSAEKSITIQNPYFLPDPQALEMLAQAVRRGVRVRVMLPSVEATDNAIVQHASHHHFGNLLKSGVEVYEYDRTLLHQKVMSVDGVWCAVGSTNFDDRSLEINDEVSIGLADPTLAAALDRTFDADMRLARRRHLAEWSNRSFWHKLVDGAAYLINEQL